MDYKQIVEKAKESYARYFKNVEPLTEKKTNDVIVDRQKVEEVIAQGEAHMAAINKIKEEMKEEATQKAIESEEKIFGVPEATDSLDHMTNDYVVYQEKLKDLKAKLEALKEK
ncbi:hypothetical protein FYJ79_06985 [Sharpea azabuensis]|jgi:predicted RNase H-like nuclease (RuvC/YqgF family)|uniref:Uncharacterized protein n=1 Tax=Sharpea porci TaxID=2652286 RepID=A0A844FVE5_9FIRM|nr:hypothetical protein [Sharpea porci]MDD6711449.1 hypothetical protein [Sharpea porci]MDY5278083.1 hypothetical protein [Sharpea porci]MST89319.1 hypothetical protein [Sharpea porci]